MSEKEPDSFKHSECGRRFAIRKHIQTAIEKINGPIPDRWYKEEGSEPPSK